jgi:hypothetical protein
MWGIPSPDQDDPLRLDLYNHVDRGDGVPVRGFFEPATRAALDRFHGFCLSLSAEIQSTLKGDSRSVKAIHV